MQPEPKSNKVTAKFRFDAFNIIALIVVCVAVGSLLYLGFKDDKTLETDLQKKVFPILFASTLALLATLFMSTQMVRRVEGDAYSMGERPAWFFPVFSGLLALVCMSTAYAYLGAYPIGERSVMTVDMHHQYAPLLAQFRTMMLEGKNPFYSFEIGLGTSILPLFAYYFSSPFNLLLLIFPQSMLTEAILVLTLLKNALSAAFFALCIQYIYKKRALHIPLLSICYSMMMYLIAYSWNLMWLDVVMILPLVVMAYEHMMRKGKFVPYVLLLAYALFANYYIAFMLCIFMVLYHIIYITREKREGRTNLSLTGRFALSSLLGGGLVMVLLVPVYISLGSTSAAGSSLLKFDNNFPMFDLFGRLLFDTSPTIRSGNLPNMYSGILGVILLPIYATTKEIPKRRRTAYLAVLGVILASFVINNLDLVWHGLHAPNDLPYRFSFLFTFVLLLIAADTLTNLTKIKGNQILASMGLFLGFCFVMEKIDGDTYGFHAIYVSILFAVIYCIALWLAKKKYLTIFASFALILLITVAELTINTGNAFRDIASTEYFTLRKNYIVSDDSVTAGKAIERVKEIAKDDIFYRTEFSPRRTTVDTAMFDYRGVSVFASSNPEEQVKFMGGIGFAINGVNSHLYRAFVPTSDSYLGIKYVVLKSSASNTSDGIKVTQQQYPYLEPLEVIYGEGVAYTIYENKNALSLGYVVDSAVKEWSYAKYNSILSQNKLFSAMTGLKNDVLLNNDDIKLVTTGIDASAFGANSISIKTDSGEVKASYEVTISHDGPVIGYIDCRAAKNIEVTRQNNTVNVIDNSGTTQKEDKLEVSFNAGEPYAFSLGDMKKGDIVTVKITTEGNVNGNIYIHTLDEALFEEGIAKLKDSELKIDSFSQTKISGTVNAKKAGTMMTTIPYDAGWTIKVDGKKVETYAVTDKKTIKSTNESGSNLGIKNAVLAFDIDGGEHEIVFTFFPRGLGVGIVLSLISLAAIIALSVNMRKKPKTEVKDGFSDEDAFLGDKPFVNDEGESRYLSELASGEVDSLAENAETTEREVHDNSDETDTADKAEILDEVPETLD